MDNLLTWLNPEMQRTLKQLTASVLTLSAYQPQQAALLATEQGNLRSLVGAIDLASQGHTSLGVIFNRLQAVIGLWEQTDRAVPDADRQTVLHACQSLQEFTDAQHQNANYSELTLFSSYSALGQLCQVESHPAQLWPAQLCQSTAQAVLSGEVVAWFSANASHRSALTSDAARQQCGADLHGSVLALLRSTDGRSVEVRPALQSLSLLADTWLLEEAAQPTRVAIFGLFHVVLSAYALGNITMDVWLKRLLLCALTRFKTDETEHLVHLSFYSYLAWQHAAGSSRPCDYCPPMLSDLAQWKALKGASYDVAVFAQVAPRTLDELMGQVERAKAKLTSFSAEAAPTAASAEAVRQSLSQLAQRLSVFHPTAEPLSYALASAIAEPSGGLLKRSVQVELATALLLLEALLGHPTVKSAADFELRFTELARRIRCAQEDQPAGAFSPWMFELQKDHAWHKTNEQLVAEVKARLLSMEQAFQAREFISLETQVMALRAIARSMKWDALARAAQSMAMQLRNGLATQDESLLANNLAAMGLFADMQAQSRHSAEALFTFDDHTLQLRVQGRVQEHEDSPATQAVTATPIADQPDTAVKIEFMPHSADAEMRSLFLEEATELLATAQAAHGQLSQNPSDTEQIVILRRAFHTLKGGARMVGMADFAQTAWLEEQQLNQLLADRTQPSPDQLENCWQALVALGHDVPRAALPVVQSTQAVPNLTISQPTDWLDLPATKVIGDLTISLALYNAYLNEADEWSRQLVSALSEWSIDNSLPLPAMTLTWAHALAGSSATVGFTGLSQLTKSMEMLIERVFEEHFQHPDLPPVLEQAANDVCRLLHQFAAGFIKEPSAHILNQLLQLRQATSSVPVIESVPIPAPAAVPPIATVEAEADKEMAAIFAEELAALLPHLGSSLRMWLDNAAQGRTDQGQRAEALRALHTLKGSARLVGQQALAQQAHDLESAIESYAEMPSAEQSEALLQQYDQMSSLGSVQIPAQAQAPVQASPARAAEPAAVAQSPAFSAIPSGEVIRVKLGLIDRLVNQSGEILIARARLEAEAQRAQHTLADMTTQVGRLREQLRELELQTESQLQSRQARFSDEQQGFDPLELDRFTRTQELTRFMAEALSDMSTFQRSLQRSLNATEDDLASQSRLAKDLQRHLLQTRMVPFDSVAERLHRLVRMASQELGKLAVLNIVGGVQELDRSVLERVTPAFEHLLRNSMVHGIEMPEQRLAMGKESTGQITISIVQNGNDVWVTVQDDGQGVDEQAVLARAKALDPAAALANEPAQLIFMSGLSTAQSVSELAGRGIGMDVVRAQVLALGGRIEVQTQKGQGTSFKLVLPLTTAVTQIVLVRMGNTVTALPANLIQTVVRAKREQMDAALLSRTWTIGEQTHPYFSLSHLLQFPAASLSASLGSPSSQLPPSVLLLSSASQTIALGVDEVLGNQEAVVKNLGPQLSQMPGLAGMTVLPTGQTVLIYNPVALATVYGAQSAALAQQGSPHDSNQSENESAARASTLINSPMPAPLAPLVMVVDDSITMRRVLQRLLVREGYRTTQAADGRQALDMLRIERPALVLSDVEMPRMDGFELLKQIRSSEKLQDLPVVMITSRIADKHRDHAKSLGANEYLGKPYPEEELILLLRQYAPV